jgi:flagellar assembly factor FliW
MTVTTEPAVDVSVPTIELVDGMPGFPSLRTFALVSLDDAGLLYSLRSLQEAELRFLVVPPAPFFPDYAPEIDDESARRLGLDDAEDAMVLLVVTVGDTPQDATANLLAPIIINSKTRAGAQVILTGSDHPLRAALQSG